MADKQRFWAYYNASLKWRDELLGKRTDEMCDLSYLNEQQSEETDESEEFLNFIIETRKHQAERERKREQIRNESNNIEYRDITELEIRQNFLNLKEPELRAELYGDKCKEIYSKELKLQFNFNEFCDKNQPNYWPLIPINLKILNDS